jgi:hypothetical protein
VNRGRTHAAEEPKSTTSRLVAGCRTAGPEILDPNGPELDSTRQNES